MWYNFHRLLFDDEKEKLYQQETRKKKHQQQHTRTGRGEHFRPVLILTSWREQLASGGKEVREKDFRLFFP